MTSFVTHARMLKGFSAVVLVVLMMSHPSTATDLYSVTDLGSLSNDDDVLLKTFGSGLVDGCRDGATGLNDRGQVVGNYSETAPDSGEIGTRGFLWTNGQMVDIRSPYPHFDFHELWTAGINNKGHIAANVSLRCTAALSIPGPPLFFSSPGVFTDLSAKVPAQNWVGAEASAINNRDQMVGMLSMFSVSEGGPAQAF